MPRVMNSKCTRTLNTLPEKKQRGCMTAGGWPSTDLSPGVWSVYVRDTVLYLNGYTPVIVPSVHLAGPQ